MNLWEHSALQAAEKIRAGQITSLDLVEACLARIADSEASIAAWALLDQDLAREQARAMDDLRRTGRPMGALHGVPVGVSDAYDMAGVPTASGAGGVQNRQPASNATVIDKAREAGAVIIGKTATTSLGASDGSQTRNPHNLERSAGGASAGSAAGVAAGHMPLAIDIQSNGSLIASASMCGVYGFKPTRAVISRAGCRLASSTLDQAGVLGRTLEDIAALADALAGHDRADTATHTRPKPQMLQGCRSAVPIEPSIAWFDLPFYDHLSVAMRAGLDELMTSLGAQVEQVPAPQSMANLPDHYQTIRDYEVCRMIVTDGDAEAHQPSQELALTMERGRQVSNDAYQCACAYLTGSESFFASFFNDFDAVLAPAALGEAHEPNHGGSDPVSSAIWTFAGLPCLSLPWLTGATGLPAGVQLIGSAEQDDRLFRTAAWLEHQLFDDTKNDAQHDSD